MKKIKFLVAAILLFAIALQVQLVTNTQSVTLKSASFVGAASPDMAGCVIFARGIPIPDIAKAHR